MIRDIIKKEILDHLLSSKFVFMFIICSTLILLSVYMGVGEYLTDKKVYDDDIAWDKMAMQPPQTYRTLLEGSLKVHRAPRTLGALVRGVEDAAGRVSITNRMEVGLSDSKYESNPLTAVFGDFDLIFIVKMILSLFAILLVHDTICGEKEKGTLKLTLSNSVPRDRLLLGKAIGGYISLCVPLLFPLLLSLIYLSLHPKITLTKGDWQNLCVMFLMFLLYLSVFFCLGLLVSSMTARSSTSLLVLLFIWSIWGIVIPKASVIIAGHLRPIPTQNEIYAQKRLSSNQIAQEYIEKEAELQKQYDIRYEPIGNAYRIVGDYNGFNAARSELNKERNRIIEESVAKIDSDYQRIKDAQAALAKNISRISPASALTFGAAALAGTGADDYTRFWKAAMDYKPVVEKWVTTNPELRDPKTNSYKPVDFGALAGMPQPAFESENSSRLFVRILPDLIAMVVMLVLLMGGAYFAFIRCDVR